MSSPLYERLKQLSSGDVGPAIDTQRVILCQKDLVKNKIATLPESFVELLRHYNSIAHNGARIYGIMPGKENFYDIVTENRHLNLPAKQERIILGADNFDYLAYNQNKRVYQIIDKEDLEVLEEYQQIEPALLYMLKI